MDNRVINLLVLVLLVLLVFGGLPHFGVHSYGYYPSGLGLVLVIILVVLLLR
jgi:hypothetical protein